MARARAAVFGSMILGMALTGMGTLAAAPPKLPNAAVDDMPAKGTATVVLAGGCFWGIEAVFEQVKGVTNAVSGYAGGSAKNAHYELVSTGTTGHAESVKVTYDSSKVTLGTLLKVFFSVAHDPTQLNRQGPDTGPQYRSAIFYSGERQQQVAKAYIDQLSVARAFSRPIVTQIVALGGFYDAEEDHQDFAKKNPFHPYVRINDLPKIDDLKKEFPELYR